MSSSRFVDLVAQDWIFVRVFSIEVVSYLVLCRFKRGVLGSFVFCYELWIQINSFYGLTNWWVTFVYYSAYPTGLMASVFFNFNY